jgi:hypothetical protein
MSQPKAKTPAAAKPAAAKPAAKPAAAKPAPKVAAKPAAAAEPKAAAPAPAGDQPAAAVPKADNLAEAPANGEHAAAAAEKKTRQQLTSILAISISQARCQTHLKHNLGDEGTEKSIKELRQQLKAAKEQKDAPKEKALKAAIADLSKTLVRISSETPIAVAVVMDSMVKELIRHGMDQAIAGDRKIVEVAHLHDGSPEGLLYHPLFAKLPSITEYNPDHEEELRKERAAANKAAKEAREAKKAAADEKKTAAKGAKGAKGAKAAAPEQPEDDEDEDDHAEHTKTTFFTYVENALKAVKKDDPYRTMRVSNRVREYLSELVTEGIARIARLARLLVQKVVVVRTMNADHIKATISFLMADGGRSAGQIAEVEGQIDAKLEVYHDHLKSEKDKKAAGLDADRKAENERKRLEADLSRKKKQAELAKKRALEASQKAQELAAETEKLEPIVAANQVAAKAKADAAAAVEAAKAAEADAGDGADGGDGDAPLLAADDPLGALTGQ